MAKGACGASRCSRVSDGRPDDAPETPAPPAGAPAPKRRKRGGMGSRSKPRDPSLPPRRPGSRQLYPRQPIAPGKKAKGMQGLRAPEYVVIGQIVADIQPDGTAVLGGTALYSALTAARLGWRVGVLTRGRYGEVVDGIAVPSLAPYAGEITIVTQDAETPTFFVNEYHG